jgi:hypothetical protein
MERGQILHPLLADSAGSQGSRPEVVDNPATQNSIPLQQSRLPAPPLRDYPA